MSMTSDPFTTAAMVTGASQGIGREIALALAQAGHDLLITDLGLESLHAVTEDVGRLGVTVHPMVLDLRRPQDFEFFMKQATALCPHLRLLVNNAGVPLPVAALDVTRADWDRIMSVNLTGTFFMTQAVGRYLMKTKRPGTIVSVASSHGVVGAAGQSPYGISKAAVMHMTRMLAIEWAEHGIRVNAVAPGKIETDSPARQANQIDPEKRARMMARIPIGRFGSAEEVAGLIRYLLRPQAAYITGQTVIIDGGTTTQ